MHSFDLGLTEQPYLAGKLVANKPDAFARAAVVDINVGALVEGGLGSLALDVVVGEIGRNAAVAGAALELGRRCEVQLLADQVGLEIWAWVNIYR